MAEDAGVEAPAAARRRPVLTILRLAIGLTLIAILLWRSDIGATSGLFARAELGHLAAALVLMVAVLVLSSVRWLVFLRKLGFTEPAAVLVRLYLAGAFFNVFLPTGIGGDAYKVVRLGRRQRRLSSTLASVFLDRLAAIVALALIAALGAGSRLTAGDRTTPLAVAAAASLAIVLATVAVFVFRTRLSAFGTAGRGLRARLGRVLGAVGSVTADIGVVTRASLLGLAAQLLLIAAHAEIARALHIDVPVAALGGGVVLTILAATLPVTVNGLGVREAVWVWTLSAYGVGSAAALSFALGALGVLVAASLIGGMVYVIGGRQAAGVGTEEQSP